ncbi:nucleoid-associated protein [Pseudomonas putida]|uniref:nucleoid-associated protein n=1 Tax=Pseudomonas putida TaxID=303 RepID=UPI00335087FD
MNDYVEQLENNGVEVAEAEDRGGARWGVEVIAACAARFIKKSVGGLTFYDSVKGKDWDLSSGVCLKFVEIIGKKFSRGGKIYGYVDPGMIAAAENISNYSESRDFSAFVNGVMERICHEANDPNRKSISVGYVVFTHYKDLAGRDQILVVMLGKQDGYDFNDNDEMTPKDTESLNLQDFRQAACIDLTGFDLEYPKNEKDSYLCFIKGKSKSEFFNAALGCSDSVPGKVCVEHLKDALSAYFNEAADGLTASDRRKIYGKVVTYIESKAGERVHLSEIQHVINKCLPENSEHNGAFQRFLSDHSDRFKVSEEFQPSHVAAKNMGFVDVKLSSGDFDGKVKLDAIAVGEKGADLSVDKDFAYLTIKLPPDVSLKLKGLSAD